MGGGHKRASIPARLCPAQPSPSARAAARPESPRPTAMPAGVGIHGGQRHAAGGGRRARHTQPQHHVGRLPFAQLHTPVVPATLSFLVHPPASPVASPPTSASTRRQVRKLRERHRSIELHRKEPGLMPTAGGAVCWQEHGGAHAGRARPSPMLRAVRAPPRTASRPPPPFDRQACTAIACCSRRVPCVCGRPFSARAPPPHPSPAARSPASLATMTSFILSCLVCVAVRGGSRGERSATHAVTSFIRSGLASVAT